MKNLSLFAMMLLFSSLSWAWVLPQGGLDKKDWDSSQLKGKTYVLFYVSPSKKNLNEKASEALKAKKFQSDVFASVAIVDLKSSWLPNGLILSSIKKKQKKYPRTIYLTDKKKDFPKILNFTPKGNDIFVFDQEGNAIYRHLGKLKPQEITKFINIISDQIKK